MPCSLPVRGASAPPYATSRTVAQVSFTADADMQLRRTALLEMDPQLLEEAGTVDAVLAVRSDVERHVKTSGHNPILEAITALATLASKKS